MSFLGKRRLCVAGCSVSDYTCIDRTYGDLLSEDIGFDYLHEAVGCGSNDRIWRRITNHIIDGNLTSNDIIIIQYTEITRTEFWSAYTFPRYKHDGPKEEASHDEGRILSFKMGAYIWQHYDIEKTFFKNYEKYFTSDGYATEKFRVNNFNFQHMIQNLGLKVIFFLSTRIGQYDENICYGYLNDLSYRDITGGKKEYNLRDDDQCHMNQIGHNVTAVKLKEHLIHLNLI